MAFVVLLALFWLLALLTSLEMATFSARKERMVQATESGDRRGTLVNAYQRAPADYLSAIQLVATAANFVIGAMIGANIEAPVRSQIDRLLPTFRYRSELSWTLSVGAITILALILTNVLPKHIGFVRANEIALKGAFPLRTWIKLTWPITTVVRLATKALARLFRIAPDEKFRVTERDIDALLAEGVRSGSLDRTEQALMRRAIRLSDRQVCDAMVPIDQVLWIDADWPTRRIEAFMKEHGRSNYPVATKRVDKLVGVVRALDFLLERNLAEAMAPPVFARPQESLVTAIERLRPLETRLLVVKEGERLLGVLTLNDILAEIVGPIQRT